MNAIERAGQVLTIIGAATFFGIFAIVLIVGRWPEWLRPVQNFYASLPEQFAFIIEAGLFLGPGIALIAIGSRLRERR